MQYMLYETDEEKVMLNNEVEYLQSYIDLQQQRFGQKVKVNVEISTDDETYSIEPMMLIPFVENAFKHGASQMMECPWISLRVQLNGNKLSVVMVNGFDPGAPKHAGGIGIENVKKRLELLYPQRHTLQLHAEEELFYVNLSIDL